MSYQSYDGSEGSSRTIEKLERTGLPSSLVGKSLLDLGCNEGFFCIAAKKRGAERVIGLDHDAQVIAAARDRSREAQVEVEFREGDLFSLPDEKFDYVLLLSTLHYIEKPAKLLQVMRRVLKPDGVLILETGLATGRQSITRALRSIDERMFPSERLLRQVWLRNYAVRMLGSSVAQAGDPIHRYVFHCNPERTNVIFIVGKGGAGKSNLAAKLSAAPLIATDELFAPTRSQHPQVAPEQRIYDESIRQTGSIWATWDKIKSDPAVRDYFSNVISSAIRHCTGDGKVIVEGFVATDLIPEIEANLGGEYQCWRTMRTTNDELLGS